MEITIPYNILKNVEETQNFKLEIKQWEDAGVEDFNSFFEKYEL